MTLPTSLLNLLVCSYFFSTLAWHSFYTCATFLVFWMPTLKIYKRFETYTFDFPGLRQIQKCATPVRFLKGLSKFKKLILGLPFVNQNQLKKFSAKMTLVEQKFLLYILDVANSKLLVFSVYFYTYNFLFLIFRLLFKNTIKLDGHFSISLI